MGDAHVRHESSNGLYRRSQPLATKKNRSPRRLGVTRLPPISHYTTIGRPFSQLQTHEIDALEPPLTRQTPCSRVRLRTNDFV
jgi:hypothetical protein